MEYVPGEFAWRPVAAAGWLFIHCLWVYPRAQKVGGLGSRLIQASIAEARRQGAVGIAAMESDAGPWMAGRNIFLENGFEQIEERERFQLVIHRLREGLEPQFREVPAVDSQARGLRLVYCAQCPMLAKSASDLAAMAARRGLKLKVTVLRTAREAQSAPSYYGVFNLMWNGRVLSDHYVSKGRFKNLLHREILGHKGVVKSCETCSLIP